MTERGRADLVRGRDHFGVGASGLRIDGDALTVEIDEPTAPWPGRIRGRVRVIPEIVTPAAIPLDARGLHLWRPHAPRARVEAAFERPALTWRGTGYVDANAGAEPLSAGFASWTWARAPSGDGAAVLFDVARRDRSRDAFALAFDRAGAITRFDPGPAAPLPATRWRIARAVACGAGVSPALAATLEDTPFYARSLVRTRLAGTDVTAFHESLSLDRFDHPIVRRLLPFRMPRRVQRPGGRER